MGRFGSRRAVGEGARRLAAALAHVDSEAFVLVLVVDDRVVNVSVQSQRTAHGIGIEGAGRSKRTACAVRASQRGRACARAR